MFNRFRFSAAGLAALLASAGSALAQEHAASAHGHEPLSPIPGPDAGLIVGLASWIVFGLVFAVLAVKVWPKISKALDERAKKITSEIEAAEQAQRKAKEALAQYEKNLADARAEAKKMLDQTKAEQAALAADLRAKADADLTQMRDKARRDIDAAKRAALKEIYDEAGNLAAHMASKILQREVNTDDQQRLMQESLAELQNVGRS